MSEFTETEKKWQEKWASAGIFEADADESKKKKFYITVAYPYLSGSLHVGHARTYTITDVVARYKRMRGYNVLFPMAWHVTGAPIIGLSKRVEEKDPSTIKIYSQIYKVPMETLETFTDPVNVVNYFKKTAKETFTRAGFGIDWRREFVTTPLTPQYNTLIEWQFLRLKEQDLIKKGSHRVRFCKQCDNVVGDHDLLSGEDAQILDYTLIFFDFEGKKLPAATLRPETTLAVVNMWINPEADYVEAVVDKKEWIVSRQAAEKLALQDHEVEVKKTLKGKELIGKYCVNPLTEQKVLILPASFVDPDNSTGVVMSVPAHAPYDHVALKDAENSPQELEKYGIKQQQVSEIKEIPLISVAGYKDFPAKEECEKLGVKNQDDEKLEEATKTIYNAEFHKGRIRPEWGEYAGMSVQCAKEVIREKLLDENLGSQMYELSQKDVVCRSGHRVYVKIIHDQWFIDYGDSEWKQKTKQCFSKMSIVPEDRRQQFEYVVDWLGQKACARTIGLGTPLPWDKKWVIESLSDSTIYMAYYLFAKTINRENYELSYEDLDYMIMDKGEPRDQYVEEMKRELEYWYPMDYRCSAKDLIHNHLCFFVFNHVALFPERMWPLGIAVNGFGTLEGEKMSKSRGNVLNWLDAVEAYGADATRLYIMGLAEHVNDFDWKQKEIEILVRQIKNFLNLFESIKNCEDKKTEKVDEWLLHRLQLAIRNTTNALEEFKTRTAVLNAFYYLFNDLRWYLRRSKGNKTVLKNFFEKWLLLLSPFTPHVCEELWHSLGNKDFISLAEWPIADESKINPDLEVAENLVRDTAEDVNEVLKLVGKTPKKITLFTCPEWKYRAYDKVISSENPKNVVSKIMEDPEIKKHAKEAVKYASGLVKKLGKLPKNSLSAEAEYEVFSQSKGFFESEYGCSLEVVRAEDSSHEKSRYASVLKPAILVE